MSRPECGVVLPSPADVEVIETALLLPYGDGETNGIHDGIPNPNPSCMSWLEIEYDLLKLPTAMLNGRGDRPLSTEFL